MDEKVLALSAHEVDTLYELIQTELGEMDDEEDPYRRATLECIQEKL